MAVKDSFSFDDIADVVNTSQSSFITRLSFRDPILSAELASYEEGYIDGYADGLTDGYADAIADMPTTPPVVTLISPANMTAIDPTDPLIVQVQFVPGGLTNSLSSVQISIEQGDADAPELAYNGTGFTDLYSGLSDTDSITNGLELEFVRTGNWRGTDLVMRVSAIDDFGNVTHQSFNWTTDPPAIVSAFLYRMRAYDETLNEYVFWAAEEIDPNGANYTGPGPLVDVVVQMMRGT